MLDYRPRKSLTGKLGLAFPVCPASEKIAGKDLKTRKKPVFQGLESRFAGDFAGPQDAVQQTESCLGLTSETPTVCYGILRV
jgi:hypothetical protein